ncbi:DUF1588 domain-containing protein [Opitutia bacterium ISCC 51]|nr:DUF1588 domain-containing protein [Opitutae bacterium ISCC 51]QXD27181.1 DUF1588 domain-containing protein [Opitutae bacterium ISCC 52]
MPKSILPFVLVASIATSSTTLANEALMETHCGKCHNDEDLKGDLSLNYLGKSPDYDNFFLWEDSLDFVTTNEMPPPEKSELSEADRERLILFLRQKIRDYHEQDSAPHRSSPRRLNNRELANSVAHVLLIEDVGTHQPVANLLGDTLEDGFDTNPDALGLSQYHLEQYITSLRRILDATLFEGPQPKTQKYTVGVEHLKVTNPSQRNRYQRDNRTEDSIEILDIRLRAFFENFKTIPESGRYRIKIQAAGIDRGIYDAEETGMYHGDPIQLGVELGDRNHTFDLRDGTAGTYEIDEWLAEGTRLLLSHKTDGLRMRGNGNFKFQYRIAHDFLKETNKDLYNYVVSEEVPVAKSRKDVPSHWVHWMDYWQGPRPRLFGAEIEGPLYESWPPKRHIAILGKNPTIENAETILRPIAERAWRREVREGELNAIIGLVQSSAKNLGTIGAFKEGIVAILVSPSFLLVNSEDGEAAERFASKFSYFLKSTIPNERTLASARKGGLDSYREVRNEVKRQFRKNEAEEFLKEFSQAWLQLDRINFMAPDPEHFPLYDRKRVSQDMVDEAVAFFEHAIDKNIPIPEFLSANYSFINADLAKVYDVQGVPQDSKLRKYTFKDGRRGGLLGMGAFLTLTADSLGTSPIHRAIYVMENLLGIHPNPPPADVNIQEPDVRQAKTIKEILAAHTADETCASCHRAIDPYGYAFENFDPMGAWRDTYTMQIAERPSEKELEKIAEEDKRLASLGLPPVPKPWENEPIPVDSSEKFRNGTEYKDIIEYRALMSSEANRDRFVRCFISKLLTYANGEEPNNYWELEKILAKSAENDYRIVDTIAAVAHSPLFREE